MEGNTKHILITGVPGVGKTTLVKKIYDKLKILDIPVNGFYTEELRNQRNMRIGFDVVALNGKRTRLARTPDQLSSNDLDVHKVGQYVVFPNDFESMVVPLLNKTENIVIIDEIGKMEIISEAFKSQVNNLFITSRAPIIATIPVPKGRPIPFVESIRKNPKCVLFEVSKQNRSTLTEEVFKTVLENFERTQQLK